MQLLPMTVIYGLENVSFVLSRSTTAKGVGSVGKSKIMFDRFGNDLVVSLI